MGIESLQKRRILGYELYTHGIIPQNMVCLPLKGICSICVKKACLRPISPFFSEGKVGNTGGIWDFDKDNSVVWDEVKGNGISIYQV